MARLTTVPPRVLRRGEVIRDREFDSMAFERLDVEQGPPDALRPTLERVRVSNSRFKYNYLDGLVLRDVELVDLKFDSLAVINFSIEFERVAVRGQTGGVVFTNVNPGYPAPGYREHLAQLDELNDTWSLDVSEAVGGIDIRGYAGHRLRLNPEHQTYVPKEVFSTPEWLSFTDRGPWAPLIALAERGDHDYVMLGDPTSRYFRDDLDFIQLLRDRGFAQ